MALRCVPALTCLLDCGKRLGKDGQPCFCLVSLAICLSQQCQKTRLPYGESECLDGSQTLAHLAEPLIPLAMLG